MKYLEYQFKQIYLKYKKTYNNKTSIYGELKSKHNLKERIKL